MKALLIVALFAVIGGANAQTLGQTQSTDTQANSAASNQGVNTTINSYGSDRQTIVTQGRTDFKTNQAYGVAPSFSSLGTAPCFSQGTGVALQVVGGGASYSGKGEKDVDCKAGNDVNLIRNVEAARAPLTIKQADGTTSVLPQDPDLYIALKSVACNVETVADAYEGTTRPCAEPIKRADRAKRRQGQVSAAPVDPYIAMSGRSLPSQ